MGHRPLGGAPRKDGTTADLDPLGHKNEGPGQQACKDIQEPTPRSHPSGFILPAGLAGQYSRTVYSLTEPLPPWPNVGTALLGRSICGVPWDSPATLSLPGQRQSSQKASVIFFFFFSIGDQANAVASVICLSGSSTSHVQLLRAKSVVLTYLVQALPLWLSRKQS